MTIPFSWCRYEVTEDEAAKIVPNNSLLIDWFEENADCELWYFHSPIYNHEVFGIAAVKNNEVLCQIAIDLTRSKHV